MVELMLFLVLDLILSIFVGPFMHLMLHYHAFMYHASLYMHCFVFIFDLMFMSLFCVSKNPKPHKK